MIYSDFILERVISCNMYIAMGQYGHWIFEVLDPDQCQITIREYTRFKVESFAFSNIVKNTKIKRNCIVLWYVHTVSSCRSPMFQMKNTSSSIGCDRLGMVWSS